MSHIIRSQCEIQNPNPLLLTTALTMVAQNHGGQVTDKVFNWWFNPIQCDMAISVPELPRGLGIKLDGGTWTWIGDFYGSHNAAAEIQREITDTYIALSYVRVLQAMGYQVQGFQMSQGAVVIEGVQEVWK